MGGEGSPKRRPKEQNQLICDSDGGRGSKNPEILRTSYMEALQRGTVKSGGYYCPGERAFIVPRKVRMYQKTFNKVQSSANQRSLGSENCSTSILCSSAAGVACTELSEPNYQNLGPFLLRSLAEHKYRFMGKEVREISRFFVAPPREFLLSICVSSLITQIYPHRSTTGSSKS